MTLTADIDVLNQGTAAVGVIALMIATYLNLRKGRSEQNQQADRIAIELESAQNKVDAEASTTRANDWERWCAFRDKQYAADIEAREKQIAALSAEFVSVKTELLQKIDNLTKQHEKKIEALIQRAQQCEMREREQAVRMEYLTTLIRELKEALDAQDIKTPTKLHRALEIATEERSKQ